MDQKRLPPSPAQLETAYFAGLGNIQGDPEMLEEIGIPLGTEDFNRHIQSGRDMAAALSRNGTPVSTDTVRKLAVICGDCCEYVSAGESCEHTTVTAKGKFESRYPRN